MHTCYTVPTPGVDEPDGVQYAASHERWYFHDGSGGIGDPHAHLDHYWLPPLHPYIWTVWRDHATGDVCISLLSPKRTSVTEDWVPVAKGPFKEMWPLFLTYVNLVYVYE